MDTTDHKNRRLKWCRDHYVKLTSYTYHVAYLDEKFFYTTSRRKKIKRLPKGKHEKNGADKLVRPKMRSRRFPIKFMFMGVVARTLPRYNFDGKILLEHVGEQVEVTRQTVHTNFTGGVIINASLKNDEWRIFI